MAVNKKAQKSSGSSDAPKTPGKLGYFTEKSVSKFAPKNNPYLKTQGAPKDTKPDTVATEKPRTSGPAFRQSPVGFSARSAAPTAAPKAAPKAAAPKASPKAAPKAATKKSAPKMSQSEFYTKQRTNAEKSNNRGVLDKLADKNLKNRNVFEDAANVIGMGPEMGVGKMVAGGVKSLMSKFGGKAASAATKAAPKMSIARTVTREVAKKLAPGGAKQFASNEIKSITGGKKAPKVPMKAKADTPLYKTDAKSKKLFDGAEKSGKKEPMKNVTPGRKPRTRSKRTDYTQKFRRDGSKK